VTEKFRNTGCRDKTRGHEKGFRYSDTKGNEVFFSDPYSYPGSVSVHPHVSFVARDCSIKANFIGRLRAMKMACGQTP